VPATGTAVFLLIFGVFGGSDDPAPAARWVGAGVMLAPALMVYAHRWAAACAAIFCALLWTSLSGPYVAMLVAWAYAAVAVHVARLDRPLPATPVPHRCPPRPAALPRVAASTEALGGVLIALAALGLGYVWSERDAVPWLTPFIAGAGLGVALLARALHHQRALRDLFALPQPVHAVRVVEQLGYVHVLLPAPDAQTALEFGFDVAPQTYDVAPEAEDGGAHDEEPHTVAALLYGEPRPGAWCTVDAGDRHHVPLGPVADVIEVPYDVVQGLPREIEDDEEQLVDPEALRPADRGVAPFQAREHRIAPPRAWAATIAIGLGAALAAGEVCRLAGLGSPIATALVTVATAAGYEFGWRAELRPRLLWHAGGVATVGFRGLDRQPWATDSAVVHDDGGTVVLTVGESVLTVPAPPPWPSPAAQRTADQLVAALRDARTQSFEISPLLPPPEIEAPRRPVLLYPACALSVIAALLVVG